MNRTSHNDRFCAGRQNKRAIESDGTLTRFVSGSSTFQSANYGSGFGRDLGLLYDEKWIFSAGGYGVHGFALRP